jgi:uncharacterized membrane protein YeaQ/YmgE (transglycosylase-associated protein family)
MTLIDFLIFLVVAGLAGAIGQSLMGYSRSGCLLSIVTGYLGALIGTWIARQAGLPTWLTINVGGTAFPFLWAVIGAALLVAVISLLTRGRI